MDHGGQVMTDEILNKINAYWRGLKLSGMLLNIPQRECHAS